jgi:GxxExxY protein
MGLQHERLSQRIIGCAIEVHRELGPGLLESVYEAALSRELSREGIAFQRQLALPVVYKGEVLGLDFRIDILVEDLVIVELKSVEKLLPIQEAQLLTYMRLARKGLGLLINFNVPLLKDGIVRRVL